MFNEIVATMAVLALAGFMTYLAYDMYKRNRDHKKH